jgi:chorismate mutase/prephenate dehydratase
VSLDELRNRIDEIDDQILALLNERANCSVEVGKLKRSANATVYVPDREKKIYDALRAKNQGPLPDQAIRAIYREIISASVALQTPIKVGFLGPRDTFSHIAALRLFGAMADFHPVASVDDVFTEVERHQLDYGVVPAETSMGGGVSDTLDRFLSSDLQIINEVMLRIRQHLLATCAREEIAKVYSKSQPFVQCRTWLKANLPQAELVETSSTAEAARIAAEEEGAAAIASSMAAETYGLDIIDSGIEDNVNNLTRFFVIGRHGAKATGHDKTALVCAVKDRPGALYAILSPMAPLNLTRIESRPSRKRAWDYAFFIDFEGHVDDPETQKVLDIVAEHCSELKILGSFPHGELEE